jgi:hypothetical protein
MNLYRVPDTPANTFAQIDWTRPWLGFIAERGERWQQAALESYEAYLRCLNADAGSVTGRGKALRFIAQDALPPGESYEAHIAATGCVPTRHNLHDFFNASMWLRFPRVKAALNALQADEIERSGIGPTRGTTRDALTLFDENAILFPCADPHMSDALRAFDWKRVFIDERGAWNTRCEAHVFGHALLEKLVMPYKACTGHAWIVDVDAAYFRLPADERFDLLDAAVAGTLGGTSSTLTGRSFTPLPVLGVPGWWPDNASPDFYDDPAVFRAGRRSVSKP